MDYRLLVSKVSLAMKKRFGKKTAVSGKSFAAWQARGYENAPEVSVIIESHNKSLQVMHVVEKLRQWPSIEIIVIDDGSSAEHTERLSKGLCRGNEFLVRANDLYENVMYNKCIRFAQSDMIALLQDDDDFDSLDWIKEGLTLLREHKDMVVLGGKDGFELEFLHDEHRARCYAPTLPKKKGEPHTDESSFVLPTGEGSGGAFVEAVNRAPMWINRRLFLEKLHNIEFSYAPFQYDDYELCMRAWLCGLSVGVYDAGFYSLSAGGMRLYNNVFTQEQMRRNGPQLYDSYAEKHAEIMKLVKARNER